MRQLVVYPYLELSAVTSECEALLDIHVRCNVVQVVGVGRGGDTEEVLLLGGHAHSYVVVFTHVV